jgi:zinc protease
MDRRMRFLDGRCLTGAPSGQATQGRRREKKMMKKIRWPAMMLAIWLYGSVSMADLFEAVEVRRLDNGMPVILMENTRAPVVTFQVWYRTGARHDPMGKTGLAHLLEHMMFKGTPTVGGDTFTRIIHENGGEYNAFTSHDFAGYYATMAADRIALVLELEADRMRNLVLAENEFETEKQVVMEERRQRVEDNPQGLAVERLRAAAFLSSPYGRPVIGWMDDLSRLTVEDARQYYDTYYTPANAFIVVVGDFDTERMFQQVAAAFGGIPAGEPPDRYVYREPPQTGERRVNVKADARQPAVLMGFHVPNIGHADAFVLEVISAVLSGGKSARLYAELVLEQELALSADAGNSFLSVDSDLFYVSGVPMRARSVEELEAALVQQLERLKAEPISDSELEKAKNQIETAFLFSQDSLFFQAMLLARYEITAGWEMIRSYLPAIRKIAAEDIQRVAATYFVPENRTVAVLHPKNPTDAPSSTAAPAEHASGRHHGGTDEPD